MLAIDRNMDWKLAQILEVRYEVPYDEDAVFWDPEESTAEVASTTTPTPTTGAKVTESGDAAKTEENGAVEESKKS